MKSNSELQLEPEEVFKHFKAISKIPRGSEKEKAVSDYIADFARERGYEAVQDDSFNLLIRKPATEGNEALDTVILQAHMDMVWNKEEDYDFDFETQPIQLIKEGDILRSNKTTLGADDGIGVAYIMAILDSSDIPHPPLEMALTTQEELGMGGAKEYDVTQLKGKTFINIDSEEEGIFCSSCCGGLRIYVKLPAEEQKVDEIPDSEDYTFLRIKIDNLRGGHSGTEIDKERGNSNRLMGRLLFALREEFSFYLADINGGTASNAIPVKTEAVIMALEKDKADIEARAAEWNETFKNELKNSDGKPDSSGKAYVVQVDVSTESKTDKVFTQQVLENAITAMTLTPHGVAAMDLNLTDQNIPETSDNFAMIETKKDGDESYILFSSNIRSSLASKKQFMKNQFTTIAKVIGASYTTDGEYPAWEYDPDSHIRKVFVEAYEELNKGKKAKVEGIHAGLECGIFSDNFKKHNQDVDLIAFGPDITGAHTPQENVSISSVGRNWELLKKVLADLCQSKD